MSGQRILGRNSITRRDIAAGVVVAMIPLVLTGCLFEGEEGVETGRETIAPLVHTSDQIVRSRKADMLAPNLADQRKVAAPLPPVREQETALQTPPPAPVPQQPQPIAKAPAAPEATRTSRPDTIKPASLNTPLAKFHRALYAMEKGERHEPVTVLHLGDSHIASDRLTGDVRDMLRARFGDAGRGLMMPGFPFSYYRARGVKFAKRGAWKAANSFRGAKGPFGVTGVRLSSTQKGARLSLASDAGPFEWAEVAFLTGPKQGSAFVAVDNKGKIVKTRAGKQRIKRVRVDHKGVELSIRLQGDGAITVLSWAVGHNRPGIRYVNLGIPGATADTARKWDKSFVAADIANLNPDLIVLGFGTNEGFNDGLDIEDYEQRVGAFADRLMASAPNAALAVIGPADGARYPRYATGRSSAGCRPLNAKERASYSTLYRARSAALKRWHAPPNLAEVRGALERIAQSRKAHYWNWSEAMGGPCAVHEWSRSKPKLAASDHVHITARGSLRSAHAFYASLMTGYDANRKLASRADADARENQVR